MELQHLLSADGSTEAFLKQNKNYYCIMFHNAVFPCQRIFKTITFTDIIICDEISNQNPLFRSRDWLSANQGPVFPDLTDTKIPGKTFQQMFSEYIEINTVFCSLKFTQNSDLKSLLQWEQHPERLGDILQRVTTRIQGEELVKFLHPIFEELFTILDKKNTELGEIVFDCIVFIICTLADNKFEQFRPVLDNYIEPYTNTLGRLHSPLSLSCANSRPQRWQKPTETSKHSIRTRYLCHVTGYQPFRDQFFLIRSVPENAVPVTDEKEIINYKLACISEIVRGDVIEDEGKQPIRTRYLGHMTGYQPISDQYLLTLGSQASQITTRFQEQFPKATMLSYTNTPPPEVRKSPEQFLQIYKVTINRRESKGSVDLVTSATVTHSTLRSQPGLLDLLKTANEQMCNKNKDTKVLIDGYRHKKDQNANALTGYLNGAINAVVMGATCQEPTDTNQNSLFRSRDWLSANQGPVFPDSVGSCHVVVLIRASSHASAVYSRGKMHDKEDCIIGKDKKDSLRKGGRDAAEQAFDSQ
eukprot:sb/3463800/